MEKIRIDNDAVFLTPMPMVLVGAVVDSKANFLAVAWAARVNFKPAMFAVALGSHHTNKGIDEHREFSINIPDISLLEKTDYCGLVSGSRTDKSELFELFYGTVANAPLIRECPVNISLTLYDALKLPNDTLYVGEVREVYSAEPFLTEGKPDIEKIQPFTLSMPDNHYWSVGEKLGKAWNAGKILKAK
jgi:flavin reductase (DIM6/NTAB) family NADH-FMN oxidoreductase RutF